MEEWTARNRSQTWFGEEVRYEDESRACRSSSNPAIATSLFASKRRPPSRGPDDQGATMGILIQGATRCPLCSAVIGEDDDAVLLPAFVWNELDPHEVFSDAALHRTSFDADPRRPSVVRIVAELESRTGPGKRRCVVCEQEITDADDYLLLPRLVDDDTHALHRYNYTHRHRSHVAQWSDFERVVALLGELAETEWKGQSLRSLINELKTAHSRSYSFFAQE